MIDLSPASRYISALLATPATSVDHWIAEDIWGLSRRADTVSYLHGLLRMHPECDRAYEVAAEVLSLMGRPA